MHPGRKVHRTRDYARTGVFDYVRALLQAAKPKRPTGDPTVHLLWPIKEHRMRELSAAVVREQGGPLWSLSSSS